MYPREIECDALAANELGMFAELQPPNVRYKMSSVNDLRNSVLQTERVCDQLSFLIGGYETDVAQVCEICRFSLLDGARSVWCLEEKGREPHWGVTFRWRPTRRSQETWWDRPMSGMFWIPDGEK